MISIEWDGQEMFQTGADAEKAGWNAKQSPLTAGTDYLAPTGSAAGLVNFPATLATDSEVATAVSSKANAASLASQAAFLAAYGWLPTGTFDATADQTITGSYDFTGGFSAKNVWLGLGDISDFKIKGASVSAGSFVSGSTYVITSVGTTDFTAIGKTGNATIHRGGGATLMRVQ